MVYNINLRLLFLLFFSGGIHVSSFSYQILAKITTQYTRYPFLLGCCTRSVADNALGTSRIRGAFSSCNFFFLSSPPPAPHSSVTKIILASSKTFFLRIRLVCFLLVYAPIVSSLPESASLPQSPDCFPQVSLGRTFCVVKERKGQKSIGGETPLEKPALFFK